MFKKQPSDNQLIFVTFILVALMGIPTFQTLTQKDEVMEMVALEEAGGTERGPASIPTQALSNKVPQADSYFRNLDLSCGGKSVIDEKIVGGFVQFKGKNCLKDFKDGDIEISNRTNGFTASVFQKDASSYQTDLIQLQQGENEIVIRYRTGAGKQSEQVIRVIATAI